MIFEINYFTILKPLLYFTLFLKIDEQEDFHEDSNFESIFLSTFIEQLKDSEFEYFSVIPQNPKTPDLKF